MQGSLQDNNSNITAGIVISPLILNPIKSAINRHGFVGFWFQGIANRAHQDYLQNCKKNILTRRVLHRSDGILSSSSKVQLLQNQYMARVAPSDINFVPALQLDEPYCYQLLENDQANKAKKLFNSYGINTVVSYPLRHFSSSVWCGRFTLLSKYDSSELNFSGLDLSLKQAQMVLFEHYHDELNPYLQSNLFNQTAIKALKMAAIGLHNHEISAQLHITVRGVEYHLESMRNKLSASNRANLVHIAHQLEII